jgi:protein O-mannosyl-transferase
VITPPGLPTNTRRDALLAATAIFAAAFLAYANSFGAPFVFDDNSSIRDNPSLRHWTTAFFPPAEHGLTVSGRPLLNLSLALNYAISGTSVWSYHVVNLFIHALNGCVLFALVRRTLIQSALAPRFARESWWLALATAGLWLLHPLQTESVTYIVQRAESLVALFYLLTLLCFVRATATPGPATLANGWLVASVVCALLGMAAKEVMATAPLMVALYDRVFVAGSWREVWRRRRVYYGALAVTWVVLGALVLATGNRGGTAGLGTAVSSLDYALTQISAVTHYLRLAVWPHPLVFDYGRPLVTALRELLVPALVLFPVLITGVVLAWRGRPLGYALMFFFVVLAPSSSVVPVVTQTMNEHRVYLPLAGLMVVFVGAVYRVTGSASRWIFFGFRGVARFCDGPPQS